MKAFFRELLVTALLALLIFGIVNTSVQNFVVVGSSMQPSFEDGERLLVNKAIYLFGKPQRGDVIVFLPPDRGDGDYIKRVIGLPGDTISVENGTVYINGHPLEEPYIKAPPRYTLKVEKVAADSYFVLGDNRPNSDDSHFGWVVPEENIVGKAWLVVWPPPQWKVVPRYSLAAQLVSP